MRDAKWDAKRIKLWRIGTNRLRAGGSKGKETPDLPAQEVEMKAGFAAVALCALALAAGCQKVPEPKTATRASGDDTSVALPASKLPPSDASIPPQTASGASGTTGSGQAGGPSQQRPVELSKQQEQSGLPLSGQVNNHSVPDTTGQPGQKKE